MPKGRGQIRPPCTIPGCGRPNKAHGLCGTHYKAKLRNERTSGPLCSVDGCKRFADSKGLCIVHYCRVYRTGSLEIREDWKQRVHNRSYQTWRSMLARCDDPQHKRYKDYGGRGIKVCERWRRFLNFIEDMGERPVGLTIDRIDTNGEYIPGNCRWTTRKEQSRNKRANVLSHAVAAAIRHMRKTGLRNKEIAEALKLSANEVSRVLRGKTWKD